MKAVPGHSVQGDMGRSAPDVDPIGEEGGVLAGALAPVLVGDLADLLKGRIELHVGPVRNLFQP